MPESGETMITKVSPEVLRLALSQNKSTVGLPL